MKRIVYTLLTVIFTVILISCESRPLPAETYEGTGPDLYVEPQIAILAPKVGDIFKPGQEISIKWKVSSFVEYVTVELYKKTEHRMTISSKTKNDGSQTWLIPKDIRTSHHYKIRISNYEKQNEYHYSDVFFILE
ncbi:MAG: GPI anchored serine-threonine rich family protein [Melioribacteraceae bacterium]|nr:GPI anchored serine-threonine rich family protein [Melioribacteraceae bacterium]MCF8356132.1 GPI anchored serine-threonine rich family protein [Melioribacteraceae bacterium]MCF8395480.1 GPI anchored serine-threonine rich family protein [Melioribacteraceae bacterium]MCF8420820.1 GPI anchored serine-threonine rich family protein [Melioribacteraceae bacterium]